MVAWNRTNRGKRMQVKPYTVSLTLSVWANDEDEAWLEFEKLIKAEAYDHDNIEIEEEPEELYE